MRIEDKELQKLVDYAAQHPLNLVFRCSASGVYLGGNNKKGQKKDARDWAIVNYIQSLKNLQIIVKGDPDFHLDYQNPQGYTNLYIEQKTPKTHPQLKGSNRFVDERIDDQYTRIKHINDTTRSYACFSSSGDRSIQILEDFIAGRVDPDWERYSCLKTPVAFFRDSETAKAAAEREAINKFKTGSKQRGKVLLSQMSKEKQLWIQAQYGDIV